MHRHVIVQEEVIMMTGVLIAEARPEDSIAEMMIGVIGMTAVEEVVAIPDLVAVHVLVVGTMIGGIGMTVVEVVIQDLVVVHALVVAEVGIVDLVVVMEEEDMMIVMTGLSEDAQVQVDSVIVRIDLEVDVVIAAAMTQVINFQVHFPKVAKQVVDGHVKVEQHHPLKIIITAWMVIKKSLCKRKMAMKKTLSLVMGRKIPQQMMGMILLIKAIIKKSKVMKTITIIIMTIILMKIIKMKHQNQKLCQIHPVVGMH